MSPEKRKLLNLAIAAVVAVILLVIVLYVGGRKSDGFAGRTAEAMSPLRYQETDDGNLQGMDLNSA